MIEANPNGRRRGRRRKGFCLRIDTKTKVRCKVLQPMQTRPRCHNQQLHRITCHVLVKHHIFQKNNLAQKLSVTESAVEKWHSLSELYTNTGGFSTGASPARVSLSAQWLIISLSLSLSLNLLFLLCWFSPRITLTACNDWLSTEEAALGEYCLKVEVRHDRQPILSTGTRRLHRQVSTSFTACPWHKLTYKSASHSYLNALQWI